MINDAKTFMMNFSYSLKKCNCNKGKNRQGSVLQKISYVQIIKKKLELSFVIDVKISAR